MQYLALAFTFIILVVNLWGGALVAGIAVRNRWLAVAAAPWLWATLLFGIETVHGLGQLRWLAFVTTLLSGFLIWLSGSNKVLTDRPLAGRWIAILRTGFRPSQMLPCIAVLALLFGYGLFWRVAFPMIDGSSEKIPDLAYICSYLPGEGVPAKDAWLSPYPSVQYYSFQYYAAALMGRLLGLGPGMTYNVAFGLMVGLCGLAFVGATTVVARSVRVRVALLAVFLLGGTGASPIVGLFYKDPTLWSGMRFIGSMAYDQTPIGLKMQEYASGFKQLEVPGEPLSYMVFLGDYHPPFSGFYLLAIAVLAAGLWQQTLQRRYAFLVGATLTWMILSNTWTFPLLAMAVGVWALWNAQHWRKVVPAVALGAAVVWTICAGYLLPFAAAAQEYKTAFRLIPWDSHTPPLLFLIYLFPTLAIAVCAVYSRSRAGVWAGLTACAALLFSEFVYVDDVYSGPFERFNTTLKWWPWIGTIVLLVAAPIVMERASRKWLRWIGWLVCLYPATYAIDLGKHLIRAPKSEFGQLHGAQYLYKDEGTKYLIGRLKVEPRGLVAERPNKDSYTNSSVVPLFAGHHLWLGWVGHEQLWHGYDGFVQQRQDRLMSFFGGDVTDALQWLLSERIDYVLWYQEADTNELRDKIHEAIQSDYTWCEVYVTPGGKHVGFWRRNPAGKGMQ
jgi:hypothetical protein